MPGLMAGERSRYKFGALRDRMREHGGRVLDFALGRHEEPPPPHVLELLRGSPELALEKCSRDELEAFGRAASSMLERTYGAPVPPSSILALPGGRPAIAALATVCIAPGDRVLVTEPGYPAFARVATERCARVEVVRLDPDRGFDPEPQAIEALSTCRVLALNYPNNPTGAVASPRALATYGRVADAGTLWFNDAAYGPLTHDRPPFSMLAPGNAPADAPVVELHTLAKHYGLGALGVAFLAGDAAAIAAVREHGEFALSPMSTLQVRAGRACLEDPRHLERFVAVVAQRLARLRALLVEAGFAPYPVQGGMYLLCACPQALAGRTVRSAAEAAERLLEEYGIAVAPWDLPRHSYLRFSALYEEADLEALGELVRGGRIAA